MNPTQNEKEQVFYIDGMDCADCARTIERGVAVMQGVEQSELNFTTQKLSVRGAIRPEDIEERVRELGYQVIEAEDLRLAQHSGADGAPPNFLRFLWSRGETRLALLAAVLVLPGLVFHELLPGLGVHSPWIDISSVLAMALAGYPVARSGLRALRISRQVTINSLMTIAAVGAVFIGAYTEAGVVMVLFAFGEAMESFTAERARSAIRGLLTLTPEMATLIYDHEDHTHEKTVRVEELKVNDRLLVKPGQRIPMDGEIVRGNSSVNQAPITGESRLVEKQPGDNVFAGTVNGEGNLEIRVTHLAEENTIARMIRLVEEAQEKQAPAQRFVDRFAAVYTPLVVVLAAGVALVPPLFFGQPFLGGESGWLYRGLALLVVACPCALVISTPVSIISAISNAARNGVLFKGGVHLETLEKVQTVAFDKTGTLTHGRPTVIRVRAIDCRNPDDDCAACTDLLGLASAVEQRSEHPIAAAVVHEARHRGIGQAYPAADGVTALSGRGVTGSVGGQEIVIGSHSWFDTHVPHQAHCREVGAADAGGLTTMLVSVDAAYQGYISVADSVRDSSRAAVADLNQLGLETVMLTGDNESAAAQVAAESGVTNYLANCLPEDKLDEIERRRKSGDEIAMVGDGINDTPALAAASIGIAMGSEDGASSQAMETADVTLLGGNLRQLSFAVRLARAAMKTIRANVALSIGIKLVFLVLVLAGTGSMWMAVLADMGTSLLVTINGMRLLSKPGMPA